MMVTFTCYILKSYSTPLQVKFEVAQRVCTDYAELCNALGTCKTYLRIDLKRGSVKHYHGYYGQQ